MRHFAYTYPWTIGDPRALANDLAELGLDGVNLAVSYHAGKFIHPRRGRGTVYFPEDGTIYFQPGSGYGKLRPQIATIAKKRDFVSELQGAVAVNAWMVLLHNSRLGFAHPDCVVRNAFGDPYYYSLCPSNPDVREYALALSSDYAASHDVESLLLETPGFLTYAHGYHHEFAQIRPNPYLDALLGLCFCESCCRGAARDGIDAHGLKSAVSTAIEDYLSEMSELDEEGGMARLEEANAALPDLAPYHEWRCDQVTSLVAEIRDAVRPEVGVRTIATCQRPYSTAYLEGMDIDALSHLGEGLEFPIYRSCFQGLESDLAWLKERVDCTRHSAILRPAWPDWTDMVGLRAAYAATRDAGFEQISFYNLGMLRPANRAMLQHLLTE